MFDKAARTRIISWTVAMHYPLQAGWGAWALPNSFKLAE